MDVFIFSDEVLTLPNESLDNNPEFNFNTYLPDYKFDNIQNLIKNKVIEDYASIYIAGYIPLVQLLRKHLISNLNPKTQMFGHGLVLTANKVREHSLN